MGRGWRRGLGGSGQGGWDGAKWNAFWNVFWNALSSLPKNPGVLENYGFSMEKAFQKAFQKSAPIPGLPSKRFSKSIPETVLLARPTLETGPLEEEAAVVERHSG